MKLLKWIDKAIVAFIGNISSILLIGLMVMVNITVFSRYIFNINLGGYEELPTMFMIVFVWLSVILVVRNDNMIKVDILTSLIKNKTAKKALELACLVISFAICAMFVPLAVNFLITHIARGTRSGAVGFPMWWVNGALTTGAIGMAAYYLVNIVKAIRRWKE